MPQSAAVRFRQHHELESDAAPDPKSANTGPVRPLDLSQRRRMILREYDYRTENDMTVKIGVIGISICPTGQAE